MCICATGKNRTYITDFSDQYLDQLGNCHKTKIRLVCTKRIVNIFKMDIAILLDADFLRTNNKTNYITFDFSYHKCRRNILNYKKKSAFIYWQLCKSFAWSFLNLQLLKQVKVSPFYDIKHCIILLDSVGRIKIYTT